MHHPHPKSILFPYTTLFRSGQLGRVAHRVRPRAIVHRADYEGSADDLLHLRVREPADAQDPMTGALRTRESLIDRKSTRLNSSHSSISYAVFCLKKKKKI